MEASKTNTGTNDEVATEKSSSSCHTVNKSQQSSYNKISEIKKLTTKQNISSNHSQSSETYKERSSEEKRSNFDNRVMIENVNSCSGRMLQQKVVKIMLSLIFADCSSNDSTFNSEKLNMKTNTTDLASIQNTSLYFDTSDAECWDQVSL